VLAEIDRSLKAHELIKVRLYGVEHADRGVLMAEICAGLEAAPVQQIGNLLVIFRAHPEERKPAPAAKTTPKDKARAGAKPAPGKPAAPRRRTRG
jgi:hypothetical protein